MGRVKEAMIEAETTGFSDWHSGEKYVCSELFDDDNIKQFIKGNGVIGNCDYCGKKTKVVDVVNLARWFHEKITQYFCPLQDDNLPLAKTIYEEDGENIPGFQQIGIFATRDRAISYDSAEELLNDFISSKNFDVIKDIANCFVYDDWVNKDSFWLREDEILSICWEKFSNHVKLTKGDLPKITSKDIDDFIHDGIVSASMGLEEISSTLSKCDCYKTIKPYTTIYRCRNIKNKNEIKDQFMDMTSPPAKYAAANRMSPKGESMFYGAYNKDVCLKEAISGGTPLQALAKFRTKKEISVLDLTDLPSLSIWADYDYWAMSFLYEFRKKISENYDVYSSSRKEIEYIPTQAFTAHIRGLKYPLTGDPIEGIIYYSSKIKNEKNIVLFCDAAKSKAFVELDGNIEFLKP